MSYCAMVLRDVVVDLIRSRLSLGYRIQFEILKKRPAILKEGLNNYHLGSEVSSSDVSSALSVV